MRRKLSEGEREGRAAVRPFIIWTLQRTGGTNLAKWLFEASRLPGTDGRGLSTGTFLDSVTDQWKLHEPFNYGADGRVFGFATEAWLKDGNSEALDAAVETVCSHRLPLKHCVEMVPWEVSEALARASIRHGYQQVFLYRRNPVARLLSMEYAQRSGVWGPNLRGQAAADEVVFNDPLPVDKLVAHERYCVAMLERAWALFEEASVTCVPVAFEDIYECEQMDLVKARFSHLLGSIGLVTDEPSVMSILKKLRHSGDQKTRDRYDRFKGLEDLSRALAEISLFKRNDGARRLAVRRGNDAPSWLLKAQVRSTPSVFWRGEPIDLRGAVLVGRDAPAVLSLRIRGPTQISSVRWDMPSRALGAKHPAARNRFSAGFLVEMADGLLEEGASLELAAEDRAYALASLNSEPIWS